MFVCKLNFLPTNVNGELPKPEKDKPIFLGIVFALLASIFCTIGNVVIKSLTESYRFDTFSLTIWRYVGILLVAIPMVWFFAIKASKNGEESILAAVWPGRGGFKANSEKWLTLGLLLLRGIGGFWSAALRYIALDYLSVADTVAVSECPAPIIVAVMAHFLLAEKLGLVPVIAAVITATGVAAMSRPAFLTGEETFNKDNLIGLGFAIGSLLFSSSTFILTRKMRKVHFSVLLLAFGCVGFIQAVGITGAFGSFKIPSTLPEFLLVGIFMGLGSFAMIAMILALKFEQAGTVALWRSCDGVFAFIFQFLFLRIMPDELSFFGVAIITLATIGMGVRKWIQDLPENDKRRNTFWFLLK